MTPSHTPKPNKFLVRACSPVIGLQDIAVNNTGLLSVTIGSKVKLSGTGYEGCWEVIGTVLGATATSIISVHANCSCT
jgi:hypothetical protein